MAGPPPLPPLLFFTPEPAPLLPLVPALEPHDYDYGEEIWKRHGCRETCAIASYCATHRLLKKSSTVVNRPIKSWWMIFILSSILSSTLCLRCLETTLGYQGVEHCYSVVAVSLIFSNRTCLHLRQDGRINSNTVCAVLVHKVCIFPALHINFLQQGAVMCQVYCLLRSW